MTAPAHWLGGCALLALGTLLVATQPSAPWDWQPALATRQPWRWWTAAFVHWSPGHLGANLAGLALVAALGWRARCGRRATLAWALAWPLTHLGLLLQPALTHYGGLSGVLHAGVATLAVHLLGQAGRRALGAALLAGLLAKVLLEAPWGAPLRAVPGWDILIAPAAHASGAAAGLLCALAGAAAAARTVTCAAAGRDPAP